MPGILQKKYNSFQFHIDRELLPTSFSNVVAYEQTRNFPANLVQNVSN